MLRKEAFQPHFISFGAGLVVAFLIAILTSAASPGLAVGVADNNAFMTPDPHGSTTAADLRLNTIRLFVWYRPGQTSLTAQQQQQLAWARAAKRRILVSVTGQPVKTSKGWSRPRGITTAAGRRAYVRFLRDLVRRFPTIKDVSVWNEPNYPLFWSDRHNAPGQYAALLAASYDALHFFGVRIYGFELHPWRATSTWIAGVGRWMRSAHRKRPLFDFVATHPYPLVRNEVPWARHRQPNFLALGDVQRLRGLLRRSFARTAQRRLRVMYTETGWTTALSGGVTPSLQATRMVQALELARCQRNVYSFMTFLVADAPDVWQTGVITNGWAAPKPAYSPYKAAIRRVRAGQVNCSKFPRAAL